MQYQSPVILFYFCTREYQITDSLQLLQHLQNISKYPVQKQVPSFQYEPALFQMPVQTSRGALRVKLYAEGSYANKNCTFGMLAT